MAAFNELCGTKLQVVHRCSAYKQGVVIVKEMSFDSFPVAMLEYKTL